MTVIATLVALAAGVGLGLALGHGTAPALRTSTAAATQGDRAGPAAGASPEPSGDSLSARARGLQALLDARASALLARDRGGWLAPIQATSLRSVQQEGADRDAPASAASYRADQDTVFDDLAPVPLGTWTWTYLGPGPALGRARARVLPPGTWVAHVALQWSLTGVGSPSVRRDQDLTVVPTHHGPRAGASAWALAGDGDGPTQVDLWDLGPVTVVRTSRAVVLGTAPRRFLAATAPLVDAAAATVDATWGTAWPRVSVVEAPATTAQLADLLSPSGVRGASTAGLDQLAAVTTGELTGASGATTGDHVLVDPDAFAQLSPLGQQVVLTHELTHVATRALAVRAAPRWLSEGFADWIGYSRSGLTREQVAGDLLAQVADSGPPRDLPGDDAFDPARTDVGPAYSGAWLAVQLLASRCTGSGVVILYRATTQASWADLSAGAGAASTGAASSGTVSSDPELAFEAALRNTCGLDRAELVAAWRARLVQLAGGS